ncbi:MAG: ATP-binding protein, partial [Erysipelotrichia bacterium]|nr:ATP-binding protein [Erysipelotrichia bacterium]
MEFTKQEWTLFRSMDTLTQKSGVSKNDIPKLVAKELTDNALDISDNVDIECDGNTFRVWNDGDGISEDKIAELFSINRPLVSSKLIKLPTRGALGNGLRVVVGAVIATGGKLFIYTNGYKYEIEPQADGTSVTKNIGEFQHSGTMIEISLGQYEINDIWASNAIFYNRGEKYKGKTSGYWYNSESFYEIAQAYDGTVYDLVTVFDGCTGTKAGKVAKLFEKNRKTK